MDDLAPRQGSDQPAGPAASLARIAIRGPGRAKVAHPKQAIPQEPSQSAEAPTPAHNGEDILVYWRRLKSERPYPCWSELEPAQIVHHWPDSVLLKLIASGGPLPNPELEASFSEVLRHHKAEGEQARGALDGPGLRQSTFLTEWIIALGRESANARRPMEDRQAFPTWKGDVVFRAVALPFSDNQRDIDHVLCHVARAQP